MNILIIIEGDYLDEQLENFDDSKIKPEELFHILGKRWALPVITELAKNDTMGFNQIKNNFQRITPSTLSSILKTLEQYGIIKKRISQNLPLSVSYFLTDYGIALHELSITVQVISSNPNSSMNKEYFRKISTIIKNFRSNTTQVLKNEVKKYLIPLATLASIGSVLCATHGIQHLEYLPSLS